MFNSCSPYACDCVNLYKKFDDVGGHENLNKKDHKVLEVCNDKWNNMDMTLYLECEKEKGKKQLCVLNQPITASSNNWRFNK